MIIVEVSLVALGLSVDLNLLTRSLARKLSLPNSNLSAKVCVVV